MIANFNQIPFDILEKLIKNPSSVESYINYSRKNAIDIDKAWDGIRFLLIEDTALSDMICGGDTIGEDRGYGPATYLTPNEVKEIADYLTKLPKSELINRYKTQEMNEQEIYPFEHWDEEKLHYLLAYYEKLVKYYQEAANNKSALLLYMS